jgi:hypothetical protein
MLEIVCHDTSGPPRSRCQDEIRALLGKNLKKVMVRERRKKPSNHNSGLPL